MLQVKLKLPKGMFNIDAFATHSTPKKCYPQTCYLDTLTGNGWHQQSH